MIWYSNITENKGDVTMKKIITTLLAFTLLVATFTSCGAKTYSTKLEDIQKKGELIIGLDDTFAPMGFRDSAGTLVGFDIDLATELCATLGVKAKFKPIDWNTKEMELSTGNIDCIWNGMSATPAREKEMSLSKKYLNNKIIIMVKPGVTIDSKKALSAFNIGVQAGSAALDALLADTDYESYKDKITEYPTYDEVILDMEAGRLDCMVIDEVYGSYKNGQMGNPYSESTIDFGDDLYAIGFRKGDTELTGAVNDALAALMENGKAKEISEKWFGKDISILQ